MTTPTAIALIDKLRHSPEILEAIRQQLNIEAGDTTPITDKQPRIYKQTNTQRDAEIVAKVHAGTHTRTDVAREYQLSLPRINQIMQMNPNPNPVKVNPNAERDAKILAKAREKTPRALIAQEFGLSIIRVNQIVGAAPKPKKLTQEERFAISNKKYHDFADLTFGDECNILMSKYERLALQIVSDVLDGMGSAQLVAKYPPDMTGGDIAWDARHYTAIAELHYNPATGKWDKS